MRPALSPSLLLLGLVLAACGDKEPANATMTAADASTDGGGETTVQPVSTGPGPGSATEGGSASEGGGTTGSGSSPTTTGPVDATGPSTMDDTVSFIPLPDGGGSGQCDPTVQDCPRGEKCTAVADKPGDPWGANTCVPVTGEGQIGDPCDIENGKYTGLDNCDLGLICLLTDDEGKGGACVEFCNVDSECPKTGAKCVVYNDGSLPICLVDCDPLVQDCPEGQACYNSAGDNFVCFKQSAKPGEGGPGSECAYINQCQKGSYCANPASVDGCGAESGCCTPYCPVSGGDAPCQGMEKCVAFFVMGMAPPGYEDVGVCVIPE